MDILTGLHGTTAISVICLLLFVEETGVPVPLLSGDVLLILAGVLIVNGSVSPWEFFPPAFVAEVAGVMVAYFWTRTIGQRGLEALADRVGVRRALDRASARLSTAGPLHITVARLVPGLRINTSLVAGAAGVAPFTFLLGTVPAIVVWLAAYTVLGVAVGVPILASLNRVQHLAVTGVVLVLIGVSTLVGVRYIPSIERLEAPLIRVSRTLAMALSVGVDLGIALCVGSGLAVLVHIALGLDGVISLSTTGAVAILIYVSAARRTIGGTAGERLTGTRYEAIARRVTPEPS